MREHAASVQPCCTRDYAQRVGIKPRSDLAPEPRLVALPWMLARPAMIAAMQNPPTVE